MRGIRHDLLHGKTSIHISLLLPVYYKSHAYAPPRPLPFPLVVAVVERLLLSKRPCNMEESILFRLMDPSNTHYVMIQRP